MTMEEIVQQVAFLLGIPANSNVEGQDIRSAVEVSFTELKRYIKTPIMKTVPFSTRIHLPSVGIDTVKVLGVIPAKPQAGLTLGTIEGANVFQVAAAANTSGALGANGTLNIQPIVKQMALSQVRNALATDLQWNYDADNQVLYVTNRSPIPTYVTVKYVPNYKDVSEIHNNTWINYLIRLSEANMKKSLGRTRSKYTIEGSNVTLDGDVLLSEANAELETIRAELENKKSKFMVLS